MAIPNHNRTSPYVGINVKPLKKARLVADLTCEQLARKIGVGVSTLNSWENGIRTPSLTHYEHWKLILGISDTQLVYLKETPSGNSD